MDTHSIEFILSRRSVRSFQDTKIPADVIEKIVQCAIFAPSAKNRQNWHFTVVTDQTVIDEMNRLALLGMQKMGIEKDEDTHIFYHAPLVVVLSSVLEGYSEVNAGCALENMAIGARIYGVESCIIGQTRFMYHQANEQDINRLLKIPEGYHHDLSICFGYPKDNLPEAKPRRENLVDYIR